MDLLKLADMLQQKFIKVRRKSCVKFKSEKKSEI